jgi:hypothetical protein
MLHGKGINQYTMIEDQTSKSKKFGNEYFTMIYLNISYYDLVFQSSLMAISSKKLWELLLINKNMKKKELRKAAGISSASVTIFGKTEI